MKQVLIKQGQAVLEEVPAPVVDAGSVLVRVTHSCISSGTELSGVRSSGQPLWKRALQRPEEVKKVVAMAATQGLEKTRSVVSGRLAEGLAVGYSAAGVAIEVGEGIDDICVGERLACAGTGYASHAEIIRVPRNLICKIPEGLDSAVASTVALGGIALQGLRRASPTLGETMVVVGLGALGQLTVQMLKANGCRVIGIDLNKDRVALALKLGADMGFDPDDETTILRIRQLTRDVGADGVIITASGSSDDIVSMAFKMCRRRGRVILVGDVGLSLKRQDIYEKELDFLVSTSYGPGRYDAEFEERGLSYPVGFVRWTETRNMQEYLDLAAAARIHVGPLIGREFPIQSASAAYQTLTGPDSPILAVLAYGTQPKDWGISRRVQTPAVRAVRSGRVRLAVVGPGGFVRAVHLPNLAKMTDLYELAAIMSRSSPRAAAVAHQFSARYASTDFEAVLGDHDVDAVLIGTRHDTHAAMALASLKAGKHVFLEKPLALTQEQLNSLQEFFSAAESNVPVLMTGFNRRFSPYIRRLKESISPRTGPMIMTYRMNAGHIAPEHWVHGEQGGGRNLGEACHIYDLFTFLCDRLVTDVKVQSTPPPSGHRGRTDNFIATIRFEDESTAVLVYTSLGHRDFPKERLEVFVDGKVLAVDDYKQLTIVGVPGAKPMRSRIPEKGHAEELTAFASAIRDRRWAIPWWQQLQATQIALDVQTQFVGSPS